MSELSFLYQKLVNAKQQMKKIYIKMSVFPTDFIR